MIELFNIPAGLPDNVERDKPVVVIDVFRASTSMAAALAAGAKELHFAGSRDEAARIKVDFDGDLIMAGERNGYRIEGYDLGNSPLEMTSKKLAGRTVLFNSTNGTRLLRRFDLFENVFMGSFVTFTATVNKLREFNVDPVICCAGTNGKYSTEDVLAGGMIVSALNKSDDEKNDAALAAERLLGAAGDNWREWARNSFHGCYLASIGLEKDLEFCVNLDLFDFALVKRGKSLVRF